MTLEEKIKTEVLYGDSMSLMLFLPFTALSIMAIHLYFAINTKEYKVIINDISYSIEAIKERDTQIHVHKIIKDSDIETMKKNGLQIYNYPNKYEYFKTCTIYKSKKQFMPLVKGGYYKITNIRPEKYILPTEKELNDCYNPSIKIPNKSPL